jgi:hypothetical protein
MEKNMTPTPIYNPPLGDVAFAGVPSCNNGSAVAWPAIFAGAAIAAATSLGLLLLGSSFGLATLSPWYDMSPSTAALTAGAVVWLIIMQWLSAALGGYITGRLRVRWRDTDVDEVFFRDTAHGFLTWAVATLFTAAFMASAVSSVIGAGTQAATVIAAADHASDSQDSWSESMDYAIDGLYRSESQAPTDADVRDQTGRIVLSGLQNNGISESDKDYLASMVARRTGISQADAERRVDTFVKETQEKADKASKTTASIALFTFLSMLVGAFIASVAAALGGRQRDII